MAITGLPDQLKVQNNAFSQVLGDDEGVLMRIKCHAPRGYLDVTDAAWDPAVNLASTAIRLDIDTGTQVDSDTRINAAGTGIITLTDDVTTAGDVAAIINGSLYWECTLCCDPATLLQTATGAAGTLLVGAITAASANGRGCASEVGTAVYFDCSAAHEMQCGVGIEDAGIAHGAFAARHSWRTVRDSRVDTATEQSGPARQVQGVDRVNYISHIYATCTYGSGSATIRVLAYDKNGVEEVIDSQAAGATTVQKHIDYSAAPKYAGPGRRLVVEVAGAAVSAVTQLNVFGGWGIMNY